MACESYCYHGAGELDRPLFGPPELEQRTRAEPAASAAEKHVRPGGAWRSLLLERLIRSRLPAAS